MALYIQAENGDRFSLDATVSVNYTQEGQVTTYAVESGFDVSDHYKQLPDKVSFSGEISNVKFLWNKAFTTDLDIFEKGMQTLKRSGEPFSCSFSENLGIMRNCLFSSLQTTRDAGTGQHSLQVSFNIVQVRAASQAKLSSTPIPASQYKDMVEEKKKGKGSTEEPDEEKGAYLTSIVNKLQE